MVSILLCLPVVTGALVMWLGDAPAARLLTHVAAGAIGALAYAGMRRTSRLSSGALVAAAAVALLAIVATLAAPGLQEVHRWLAIGSLRIHPSALLVPPLMVLGACRLHERPRTVAALLLSIQAIHLLQPDAGQATALAAATVVALLGTSRSMLSLACAVTSVALAGATWLRPDPLPPAPFVEDIVARAFAIGPVLGTLALVSLVAAVLAPLVESRGATGPLPNVAATALTVYFAAALLVAAVGNFPVPLLGFGSSPVLGAFLGLGALRAAADRASDVAAASLARR
jgi:hypothetical protein